MSVQEETLGQGAEVDVRCVQSGPLSHILMVHLFSTFLNFMLWYFLKYRLVIELFFFSVSIQSPRSYGLVCLHGSAIELQRGVVWTLSMGAHSDSCASEHLLQSTLEFSRL